MNNGNDEEVIAQLKSIKKWVIAGAIGFLLIGLSALIFTISIVQMTANIQNMYASGECGDADPAFSHNVVSELIKQGKLDDAVALIDARLSTHPNDAYAHWYKARILVLKKEWKTANEHIEKLEIIAPSWEEEYIEPLRKKIRESSE